MQPTTTAREHRWADRADRAGTAPVGLPAKAAVVSARGYAPDTLVGRDPEVARLERALDELASDRVRVLEISGEPGIGKSRLLAELARRAEARGYLVLDGRAAEFERDIPFGVVVDALNDHAAALDPSLLRSLDDEALRELAALLPSLAGLVDEPLVHRLGSERYRAHYAIRALLEALARVQPTVLTLDDLHWADDASIEVIGHLARRFRGPLLVASAVRRPPPALSAVTTAAERSGLALRLELAPLAAGDADALLGATLDAGTRAALYAQSGGNPFYLRELAQAALRAESAPGQRPAAESASGEPFTPPARIVAAIGEELARLPPGPRQVLDAAAVAGDQFEPELVAAIADRSAAATLAALDALLAADLVRTTAVPRRFRFRHPIVRHTVYEGMPGGWRLGAHARASAALEATGASPAARAHHVERSAAAGDEHAIALLIAAARASASSAPRASGFRLRAALRLLPPGAGFARRLTLLTEAAAAFAAGGAHRDALAALNDALPLVGDGRPTERAALIVEIAAAERQLGHRLESRSLLERALASLDDQDGELRSSLRLELAQDSYLSGEFVDVRGLVAGLELTPGRDGDALLGCLASALTAAAEASLGRLAPAAQALDRAEAAFRDLDDERLATRIDLCGWIGLAAIRLERIDDALAFARRGLVVARARQQGSMVPGLLGLEAQALLLRGRVTEALGVAETAADAARLTGSDQLLMWSLQTLAGAASWSGDQGQAIGSAREAVVVADRVADSFFAPLAHVQLAGALLAAGDARGAAGEIAAIDDGSIVPLLDLGAGHGWELLVDAHLALGDLDAAHATADRARRRAESTELRLPIAGADCAIARVALARGDLEGSVEAAERAAIGADRAGNILLAARARRVMGVALQAQGAEADAIAVLRDAHRTLAQCGARREADLAAQHLRRLGQRVARPGGSAVGPELGSLTARERQVADEVARGKTNRSVATALFLSEKTIESHLGRIYEKLGVHSRVALAALITGERPAAAQESD
jgi:ATP/maltotriose-dependent transcriptional regulator MalT